METEKQMPICEDCKKRKAVLKFSNEPFLAISHGWGIIELCRQCFIKRLEKHIEECKKQIKEQKRLIKETEI